MAWYHQEASNYLSQCWLNSMSPYDIIRDQLYQSHSIPRQNWIVIGLNWKQKIIPIDSNDVGTYWTLPLIKASDISNQFSSSSFTKLILYQICNWCLAWMSSVAISVMSGTMEKPLRTYYEMECCKLVKCGFTLLNSCKQGRMLVQSCGEMFCPNSSRSLINMTQTHISLKVDINNNEISAELKICCS